MKSQAVLVFLVSALLQFSTIYGFTCHKMPGFTFPACEFSDDKEPKMKHLQDAADNAPYGYTCAGDPPKCCSAKPDPTVSLSQKQVDGMCKNV
ncbi:hypothetical protein O181_066579 [Austropuccinia psidii MF-1]|uniref:Uncharacterized protein n=1 Tax=Austropuccinia psidii MF-1 TaxID=1389203 RepID=A0A9Q3ETQ6_9BASI|nr:hypothetical protein [Austropuccinia psidii MF-1]